MSDKSVLTQVLLVISVVALTAMAGCLGSTGSPDPVGPDQTEPQTGGFMSDPPPQNPWETENITVKIVDQTGERDYRPHINESLKYWNQNLSQLGWEGQFIYDEHVTDPDVRVHIVEDIPQCGYEDDTDERPLLGCAPIYNQTGQAIDQADDQVEILGSLNNSSTVDVATHEFGHTIGLTHNDSDSWEIMNATTTVATTLQPNATKRVNPFESETISVYYNESQHELNSNERDELEDVWEYYNDDGSEIVPSNVSFRVVENESEARLVVQIVDDLDGGASIAYYNGFDPDADGAIETYSSGTVFIHSDVDEEHIAWHVGRWTTYMFSSQEEGALPDELTSRARYTRENWPS